MMKSICYLLLAFCVLSGCQSSQPAATNSAKEVCADPIDPADMIRVYRVDGLPYEPSDDYEATRAALETKLSIENDNSNFSEVVDFVCDEAGVNLAVNWSALELVGIDQDSLVTLTLNDVPARTLLELVLEQVSADAFDDDKAGFGIRDGVVKVSTRRDLYKDAETRIYDVSWFVDSRLNINTQLYERDEPKRTGWLRGRKKDTGEHIKIDASKLADWHFFCAQCWGTTTKDGEITFESISREELIDQLVNSIIETIGEQNEWLEEQSSIREMIGRLIVTTTPENHDAILEMLKMHRRLQVDAFEAQAKAIAITLLLRDAEKHRLSRDYTEALELIDQALRVDPNHAEAQILRKLVLQAMRD